MPVLAVKSEHGVLPRKRDYSQEEKRALQSLSWEEIALEQQPLEPQEENQEDDTKPEEKKAEPVLQEQPVVEESDPLGAAREKLDQYDPLSTASNAEENPLAQYVKDEYDPLTQALQEEEDDPGFHRRKAMEGFVPWESKRAAILKKYTTNEKVSISFMDSGDQDEGPSDTVRDRLEELEGDQAKATITMTQQEYLKKIETMHNELLQAWNENQRVKALKIVIQCSKLLSDTAVIKFYPSKFVLITEILDTFGRLVFDRLRGRSVVYDSINAVPIPLPEDFRAEDVTPMARETCRNWFFKIASIRELLPRVYVEMALINSYRFISNNTFSSKVKRISTLLRGIGDPLVATYARAYLVRKGREVGCYSTDYVMGMFCDHVVTHVGLEGQKVGEQNKLDLVIKEAGVDKPSYMDLYTPALEWILHCIGHNAEQEQLDAVLVKYKESNNPLILDHIFSAFRPSLISPRALEFSVLIRESNSEIYPWYKLYRSLGAVLCLSAPPTSKRLNIMNEIWRVVSGFEKIEEYMSVAEVFIEFPAKYLTPKEMNVMLADIVEHVKKDHIYEDFQEEISTILMKILEFHKKEFVTVFAMDKFMPLADLLFGEVQVKVNREMLESFCQDSKPTADPFLINAMFEVGKVVHDSINSLSFQDEIRQIANLIAIFIKKINFGMDLEKQLNFYVDCRRAFGNLDSVKKSLILVAAGLAMKTHKIIQGRHTKRTAAFVRACIAFCFITIPSMDDLFSRLHLYLLAGQAALINQCLPQSEALFEAAVDLLAEVPDIQEVDGQIHSTEVPFLQFISSLTAQMVVIPGHPEHGPFYLIQKMLEIIDTHQWDKMSIAKSRAYLRIISMLCTIVQDTLPYHIENIESNDTLYGGDTDYQQEVQNIIDSLVTKIVNNLQELTSLSDVSAAKFRVELATEFLQVFLANIELNETSAKLVLNLYKIANSKGGSKSLKNAVEYLRELPAPGPELYDSLRG